MIKFTCVFIKEVISYLKDEDDIDKIVEDMEYREPLICFHVTGHLFAREVAELDEIREVIERTYINKKYLVEINMLEYIDGDGDPDNQEELDYVKDNFDILVADDKITLINTDYFTMNVSDVD